MRILFGLLIGFVWSLHVHAVDLVMEVGSNSFIAAPSSGAVRVKNGKLVSVDDQGSRLKITAKKTGHAVVTTKTEVTNIYILNGRDFKFYELAASEIESMRGLQIEADDEGVVISGELLRASDLETLSELPGAKFKLIAKVDFSIQSDVQKLVERKLKIANLNLPSLQFEPFLSVLIAKEQSKSREQYETSLSSLGAQVIVTENLVELQPLVRVRIAVTEIRRKFMQKLGVSWPATSQAQLLPSWIAPGKLDGVTIQLDALEEKGFGKILASPTLLCRSGKNAEFFAGGEFPIKVVGHKTREVMWKKHGINLKVAPVADRSGRMSIALTTEVSTIDQSQTVDGVPGLLTNRIESHFDLNKSRTIALSGLIKEESGNSRQGLPGLSSIPILGLLFSSQDYRDFKTELVVFVTPEVVSEEGEAE